MNVKFFILECPFCFEIIDDILYIKNSKVIKVEKPEGYFCPYCNIRIPETLINDTMKNYEEKFD